MKPPDGPLTDLDIYEDTGTAGWNGQSVNIDYLLQTMWRPPRGDTPAL